MLDFVSPATRRRRGAARPVSLPLPYSCQPKSAQIWTSEKRSKMAAVDPVVLAAGTVREVTKNEFVDRSTGQVENRGRKVTLLTRAGFLVFNVPTAYEGVPFEVGAPCAVWVLYREWEMNGRRGVTLVFDQVTTPEVAAAVLTSIAPAEAVTRR